MKIPNALALVVMLGVTRQSVSTPSSNGFIAEKFISAKNSENKNVSLLYFTKIAAINQHSKNTQELINENKPGDERSVRIPREKDELKQLLQPARKRFGKRNKTENTHVKRSLYTQNRGGEMPLKRIENIDGSSRGVKTRIRRVVLVDDTNSNEDEYEAYKDDDFIKDYIDDYEVWLNDSNGVRSTTTPTTINRTIVRKCCPNGETFLQSRGLCSRSHHPLLRHFHAKSTTGMHLEYIDNSPCTFGGYRLLPHKDKYSVSDEGFLSFKNKILSPQEFCFEAFLDKEEVHPVVCYKERSSMYIHIIIGKAITIPFLLITLFIYIFIAELHNAFGIAALCHTTTLLFAYIVFLIVEHVNPHTSFSTCRSFAFVIFIMFQSSFFWLNVMCYDLCWFISMLKTLSKKAKIVLYSCYAWGMPLILVIVFLHRDIVPGIPGYHLKPEYGEGGCRYSAHLDHFYPPVILLQVCNVILFTITFFKMLCSNRGNLENQRQQIVQNKQRYTMYILNFKLFLVKGMVTVPLIVMWALDAQIIMWYLINIQEIFLCVSLVFNDNIMNSMERQKYTFNNDFGYSLRQRPQECYSAQNRERNSNSSLSPCNDKNRSTDLKMKTLDAKSQVIMQ